MGGRRIGRLRAVRLRPTASHVSRSAPAGACGAAGPYPVVRKPSYHAAAVPRDPAVTVLYRWRAAAARLWSRLPLWARYTLVWWFNAHFVIGAVAVVRDDAGRVLVARHTYRRRRPWGLPGGWVRRGEDPAETVVREVLEESGLRIRAIRPMTVQREAPHHLTVVYAARPDGGVFRPSDEVTEIRYIVPGEWPEGLREDHRTLILASVGHPSFTEGPPVAGRP